MRVWLGPVEELRVSNVADAVTPQAIAAPGWRKLPVWDNDPTRNISSPARVVELLLMLLAVAALVVLGIVSIVMVVELS